MHFVFYFSLYKFISWIKTGSNPADTLEKIEIFDDEILSILINNENIITILSDSWDVDSLVDFYENDYDVLKTIGNWYSLMELLPYDKNSKLIVKIRSLVDENSEILKNSKIKDLSIYHVERWLLFLW